MLGVCAVSGAWQDIDISSVLQKVAYMSALVHKQQLGHGCSAVLSWCQYLVQYTFA